MAHFSFITFAPTWITFILSNSKLVVLIGFTALLRWLSSERRAFVATATPATLASEQPAIEDVFDFQEVLS